MFVIKFPILIGKTIGAYSYSTGENIGDGVSGGTSHIANVSSSSLDQSSFEMTIYDRSLNAGDTVDFSFKNELGHSVTVTGATIQQSSGASAAQDRLQGIITAIGKDATGMDIAMLVQFRGGKGIQAGKSFFDNDTDLKSRDVQLDPSINFLYIGNYADADPTEAIGDANAESAENVLNGVVASSGNGLTLVAIQPVDARRSVGNLIGDNDIQENGRRNDGGDYAAYTHPATGKALQQTTDSTLSYNAVVRLGDGTSRNIVVTVIQMENGDVFVTDLDNNGTLDGLNIQSIKLIAPVKTDHFSWRDNQSVDGTSIQITEPEAPVTTNYANRLNDDEPIDDTKVTCFTQDVPIKTPDGNTAAGKLRVGDIVLTADHGPQPIRWIGRKRLDAVNFAADPKLYPVRISKGALGCGLPTADILVSRQHRMLVRSEIAHRMFGTNEILVPAIKLIGIPGIESATDSTEVTYIHILFDRHEIVFAADAPTESLFTGPEAIKAISRQARQEILTLFPQLEDADSEIAAARPILPGKEMKQLMARHVDSGRPVLPYLFDPTI